MTRDVDVLTETVIRRPCAEVAAYADDPTHAPEWYANIASVEWVTAPPIGVGARMDFVASFLGRRLAYTYEVVEFEPGRRLVMCTAQGPFPMESTSTWQPLDDGATRMTLRNRGRPSGFAAVAGPVMAAAVKRADRQDLAALRHKLESGGQPAMRRRAGTPVVGSSRICQLGWPKPTTAPLLLTQPVRRRCGTPPGGSAPSTQIGWP